MTRLFRQFVALVLWATMSTPALVESGFACAMPSADVATAGGMSGMDMTDMADMDMTGTVSMTPMSNDVGVPHDAPSPAPAAPTDGSCQAPCPPAACPGATHQAPASLTVTAAGSIPLLRVATIRTELVAIALTSRDIAPEPPPPRA